MKDKAKCVTLTSNSNSDGIFNFWLRLQKFDGNIVRVWLRQKHRN